MENRRLLKALRNLNSDLSFPIQVRFRTKGKVFYIKRPVSAAKNSILYEGYRLVGTFTTSRMFLKSYIQSSENNAVRNFYNDIAKYDTQSKIIAVDPQNYLIALEYFSDALNFYQGIIKGSYYLLRFRCKNDIF